jgi:hypothetical protein
VMPVCTIELRSPKGRILSIGVPDESYRIFSSLDAPILSLIFHSHEAKRRVQKIHLTFYCCDERFHHNETRPSLFARLLDRLSIQLLEQSLNARKEVDIIFSNYSLVIPYSKRTMLIIVMMIMIDSDSGENDYS